ncbi:Adenosyl-chloride synthase [Anaerolineae bacterium]|nr:Adenosyl-chloride synthase [Anaerolineae bacterium]
MNRIITLTTDFGLSDGFVGTMKGVILGINPEATIVDITHDIAPQKIESGAFLFANAVKYFPANAIHVVVVDPGVGSARRPIAMQIGETIFVAPDNGVLSRAIQNSEIGNRKSESEIRAVYLNRPAYWLPRVSHTFHGRDIFAPVAAHLSRGIALDTLGDPLDDWVRLAPGVPTRRADGALVGKVLHIDRFGNLITNIADEMLAGQARARIEIAGSVVNGIKQTYADVARGEIIALVGSTGQLEIAVRDGNAAQVFGVRLGDEILIMP